MDDGEGALSFDFEGGLDAGPPPLSSAVAAPSAAPTAPDPAAADGGTGPQQPTPASGGVGPGRRSFRQTVCRHWLRSLCMKGDACGFLHQYDKSRMPVCRFFRLYGECREQDCVYKHTNEDIKECNMYKMGFCPNGPDCRYRHQKLPGPPPPVEEVLPKIQHLSSLNYGFSNRSFQNRNNHNQQRDKPQLPQTAIGTNQNAAVNALVAVEQPGGQQNSENPQPQQQSNQSQVQNLPNGMPNQPSRTAIPLPQGPSRFVWNF